MTTVRTQHERPESPQRRREARARLWGAVVWAVGATAVALVLLKLVDDSPTGRAFAVGGGVTIVGALFALLVAVVNGSLVRDPSRGDAGGPADLAFAATLLCPTLGLVVGAVAGRPYELLQVPLAGLLVFLFALLGLLAFATRHAARRAQRASRPQPSARRSAA